MNNVKKTSKLKEKLKSNELSFFMEAHNAISGKVVDEAGFDAVWGSSLTISASLGKRDNNELSWKEIVDICDYINSSIEIPMLVDIDTGYGNFNNARQVATKLERIGIAGVCIEDKLFPKMNSFINSSSQILTTIDEFCGKIEAIKDAQQDNDFCVIARTEAMIVGAGLEEALNRAHSYYRAGADALFIHSKKSSPEDIISFMKAWEYPCPIIIAPTTYYDTPTSLFENIGISAIIWANMMLRASVINMRSVAQKISKAKNIRHINDELCTMQEIFRYQNMLEYETAEKKYLFNKL